MAVKNALVTGGGKGIGLATVEGLHKKGYRVFLGVRDQAKGQAALLRLKSKSIEAELIVLDVSNESSVRAAAEVFGAQEYSLDVLVNNAGILPEAESDILNVSEESLLSAFKTNCLGALFVTRAFLPYLKNGKSARVINVSSGAGQLFDMESWAPAYSLSKTALNAVTRQYAAALSEFSISVNSICPGWVSTDMGGVDAPRSVEEGADTIIWLATEADQAVSGKFFRDRKEIAW